MIALDTNILIALGSAIFTLAGITMAPPPADPLRIAAQIVTGIDAVFVTHTHRDHSPLAAWLVSSHDWRTSMQIIALVVAPWPAPSPGA